MNFWEFLDRQFSRLPGWPTGRGLVGMSMVFLTVMILWMLKEEPQLRHDDFFKTIAGAIIITGLINSVVAFFYSQNHAAEQAAMNRTVEIGNPPSRPVPVEESTHD